MVQKRQRPPPAEPEAIDPKRRGRPRAYQPEIALAKALDLFRKDGFAATSLDDLSAATGMNRPSLYGAFGDKRELYLKSYARSRADARAAMIDIFRDELPIRKRLQRIYAVALDIYLSGEAGPRGCFTVMTAASEAVADPDIDLYALTHNETSTGVAMTINRPAGDVAPELGGGLVAVDATSGAGGMRVDPSQFDAYYFAPQKCFAADGGLWVALLSPAALERVERLAASDRWVPAFFDLKTCVDNSKLDQTYNTPALATLLLMTALLLRVLTGMRIRLMLFRFRGIIEPARGIVLLLIVFPTRENSAEILSILEVFRNDHGRVGVMYDVVPEVQVVHQGVINQSAKKDDVGSGAQRSPNIGERRSPREARIDVNDLRPLFPGLDHPLKADRVILGHIGAHDENCIRIQ